MRLLIPLLLVVPALAGCGTVATPLPPSHAASLQRANLGWLERFGDRAGGVEFGVRSLAVTRGGWQAQVSIANKTSVPFAVGKADVPGSLAFGLMLFSSGLHSELEKRNANGSLPTIRPAETFAPVHPARLQPRQTWRGTIAARGPLAAGTWARVVFGVLAPVRVPEVKGTQPTKPVPKLPDALREASNGLVWITDHAYELRR